MAVVYELMERDELVAACSELRHKLAVAEWQIQWERNKREDDIDLLRGVSAPSYDEVDGYRCGTCGADIERDDRYCGWCGQLVDWDPEPTEPDYDWLHDKIMDESL